MVVLVMINKKIDKDLAQIDVRIKVNYIDSSHIKFLRMFPKYVSLA